MNSESEEVPQLPVCGSDKSNHDLREDPGEPLVHRQETYKDADRSLVKGNVT